MGDVHKLQLVEVGDNFRFEADDVLRRAMGQELTNLVVICEHPCGHVTVGGMASAGQAVILMHRAIAEICGIGGHDD